MNHYAVSDYTTRTYIMLSSEVEYTVDEFSDLWSEAARAVLTDNDWFQAAELIASYLCSEKGFTAVLPAIEIVMQPSNVKVVERRYLESKAASIIPFEPDPRKRALAKALEFEGLWQQEREWNPFAKSEPKDRPDDR